MLVEYVHPFLVRPSTRQRLAPLTSRLRRLDNLLGKRIVTESLSTAPLHSAAALQEAAHALTRGRWAALDRWLLDFRNRRLARRADILSHDADLVVVSYGVVRHMHRRGRARVALNMPNCHPAFQNEQLALVARAHPQTLRVGMTNDEAAVARADMEIRAADLVLCGSEFVASTLRDQGASAASLLIAPYGVAAEQFVPRTEHDANEALRVVCVAQVTPHKGILDVLDAFEGISPDRAKLTVYGSSPHGLDWLAGRTINLVGRIPHAALAAEMREADVLVLASWYEGLPLAVLEGMASGLACIVTARGADQVVRDGREGIVVPPGEPAAIREAILRLAADRDLLARMRSSARKTACQLTWETYGAIAIDGLLATQDSPRLRRASSSAETQDPSREVR
jgi:glycosyltransferase involved in cell wall biosynthesis